MSKESKILLTFIVKGAPYKNDFALGEPMEAIITQVLEKTGNVGQNVANWTLKDEQGITLPLKQHLRDYNFENGTVLYLETKVGGGGIS